VDTATVDAREVTQEFFVKSATLALLAAVLMLALGAVAIGAIVQYADKVRRRGR